MGFQQTIMAGRKWPNYRFFRYARTTQERRAWDAEYGRAIRSDCNLPQVYDDL